MKPVGGHPPQVYLQAERPGSEQPGASSPKAHAAVPSEPGAQAPSLGALRRYPAGRYAHLAEAILSMRVAEGQAETSQHTAAGAGLESHRRGSTSGVSGSRVREALSAECMAADLAELARWSETGRTYSLDPRGDSGLGKALPAAAVASMLDRGKAIIKNRLAAVGITLNEVVVAERRSHLDINLNYLELSRYLKRDKGMWLPIHNNLSRALYDKAGRYLEAFTAGAVAGLGPLDRLKSQDSFGVMRELLAGAPGLVIGEAHYAVSSKRELILNMQRLKDEGVSTLFFEHLCADVHGKALHEYGRAPQGSPMPARLKAYLDMLTSGNLAPGDVASPYNFTTLLAAAQKAGMQIVPIDTAETYATSTMMDNTRIKVMNYYAAEKIRLSQPEGKWIAFVGSAHATRYEGIPGLAELRGVRSLIIDDLGGSDKAEIHLNVEGYGAKINPDVTLSYKV
jgi:hypothetical protein